MSTETYRVAVAHTRTGWNITVGSVLATQMVPYSFKLTAGTLQNDPVLILRRDASGHKRTTARLGKLDRDTDLGEKSRRVAVGRGGVEGGDKIPDFGKTLFEAEWDPEEHVLTIPIVGKLKATFTRFIKKVPEGIAETPTVSVTAELRKLINKVNDIKMELDGELTFHIDEGGLLRARIQVDL